MSWGMGLGNAAGGQFTVHGTQGTLDLENWALSPAGGAKGTKVKPQKIVAEKSISHMANWLQCMRLAATPQRRHPVRPSARRGHDHGRRRL